MAYPDAYVRNGEVYCIQTDSPLPSYSGLVLANLAGRWAILYTQITTESRSWELVQWGSSLSSVEIDKFMRGKM